MLSHASPQIPALSAPARIACLLRERILRGELAPGTPLREVAIAAELTTSRNTLREGLRLLASEGLVTHVRHKGAVIRRLTAPEVRDIYQARRVLEAQAIRDSVTSRDMLAGLAAAVISSEQAELDGAWRAASTASLRFHQALVGLLGNRQLDQFFHALLAQLRLGWAESRDEADFQRSWAARDRELYDLIRAGRRAHAISSLMAYLQDAERQVLDTLRRPRTA